MATQPSTGLTIALSNRGIKEVLDDFIIEYRDGVAPTISAANLALGYSNADAAVTGNLLCTLTKEGATLTGTASTRQIDHIAITRGSTNDTVVLTFSSPAKTLTYVQTSGDTTADILTTSVVAAVNADITLNKVVEAIAITGSAVTESIVYLRARYPGEGYALTAGGTGGANAVLTSITANVRINTLHFDYPDVYGDVPQEAAYTWLGTGLVRGTATYFRMIKPGDDGTQSFTAERLQGNISTAGADINMDPTNQITVGQIVALTGYKLKFRKSVAT